MLNITFYMINFAFDLSKADIDSTLILQLKSSLNIKRESII